ncbi:hypothetical protein Dsin_029438 [Dipteronia sinensis]|uniref:Uncharacterized protein n=1 Tax=Dipteronia sinensis TaxID=43782 RepID=A0AAD9ZTQ4_9ROSI|nr:hypothetical protein Dsin_029438 [Dipteronia sinensis]
MHGLQLVLPLDQPLFMYQKEGGCNSSDITLRMDGTLVAPTDFRVLGKAENWVSFDQVSGGSIIGGSLDAKGSALWVCKAYAGTNCPNGATTLSITNSNNIRISGLLSLNSQLYHIVINRCQDVIVEGIKVIASGNSLNIDGIHVQQSMNVKIINSSIKTGMIVCPFALPPTTCGLKVSLAARIGSLGKDMEEEGVQNVTVKNTIFKDSSIEFLNVEMIILQFEEEYIEVKMPNIAKYAALCWPNPEMLHCCDSPSTADSEQRRTQGLG